MGDNQIKITIAADTQTATSNVSKLALEFKQLSDQLQKPLGQIDSFVSLKKSLTENEAALKAAKDRVAELAGQMKIVGPLPPGFSDSFVKAKKEASDLDKTVEKQRTTLSTLRQSMQASGVDTTKLASEQLRLKAALKEATDEFQKYKTVASARDALGVKPHQEIRLEIDRLKQSYRTLASSGKMSFSELAQAKVSLSEKIRDLKSQTNGWSEGIEKARGAIIGLVAAAATIKLSVTAVMEFETGLSNVAKVVDAPKEKIAELGENILLLTRVMPQSAKELLEIAEAGGQMGLAVNDIEAFVTATAKIATAFKIPAKEAGEAVGALKNIYKLTIPEIVSLADAVNVLGNNLETSEAKIIHVLTRAGAMPRLFGLSEVQAAALAGAMTSLGMTEEQAGTAITAFLSKLRTVNVASDEVKGALQEIGIDLTQIAKDIEENPQAALLRFLETLKKLSSQKQMEVLKVFAGEEYQKQIGTLLDGLDKYKQSLDLVSDKTKYAGSAQKEFEKGMETLSTKVDLAKNSVIELGVRLGNLEISKAVIDGFTNLMRSINDFAKANPAIAQTILGVVTLTAGLGALRLLGGGALTLVAKGLGTLGGTAGLIKGLAFETELLIARFVNLGSTASTIAGSVGLLGLALADAWAVAKVWQLGKLSFESADAMKDTARIAQTYEQLAKSLEQYKDFKLKTLNELKLMNEDQLREEYDSLQKALKYWSSYREQLEQQIAQMPDPVPIFETGDFVDPTGGKKGELQKQLEEAKQKVEDLMEAFKRTGEAARANGVDLQAFGQSAQKAGSAATELSADIKKVEVTAEQAKKAISDLGKMGDLSLSALEKSYDFAAEKAKILAKDEKEATKSTLDIYRQKRDTIISEATKTAALQLAIIEKSNLVEKQKAEESKKIHEDLKNTKIKASQEWLSKLEAAYLDAVRKDKDYAAALKKNQQDIAALKGETASFMHDAQRQLMAPLDQYKDKLKEVQELIQKARLAYLSADSPEKMEEAIKLMDEAKQKAKSLQGEVKQGDEVIITAQKSMQESIRQFSEAEELKQHALEKNQVLIDNAATKNRENMQALATQIDEARQKLDALIQTPVDIKGTISVDASAVEAKIKELQQPTSSTHTIYVQTVQQNRWGGVIRAFAGGGWNRLAGKLPGWGGGDKVRALLEAGEFIIRKEAVAKYGAGIFEALNNLRFNLSDLAEGLTLPSPPKAAYAEGGMVSGFSEPTETILWKWQIGEAEIPLRVTGSGSKTAIKALEKELERRRLTKSR